MAPLAATSPFYADFGSELARAALETVAISVLGTAMAAAVAGALVFLAAGRRPPSARRAPVGAAVALAARAALAVLRSIPELVLATLAILAVGLGPFPGAIAIALHTAGVLGKLYADALENVDPRPIEALEALGASPFRTFLYAALPQALPQCVAYTLYRWEVNIRAAAVLGFVGAGGLGTIIRLAVNLHWMRELALTIAVLFALVTAVDATSYALRRRFMA